MYEYKVYNVLMKRRKKKYTSRTLNEKTLCVFLKTIFALKRKMSISSVITKIQTKDVNLRPSRGIAIINHLQKDGYLRLERGTHPLLTEKGLLYLENTAQKQKTHWDKRFRIILFQSIQTTRNNREYIRKKIKQYGFMHLKRGVWIYPYVCDAFIQLLQREYLLKEPVMYIIAQDNESMIGVRKYFRLR